MAAFARGSGKARHVPLRTKNKTATPLPSNMLHFGKKTSTIRGASGGGGGGNSGGGGGGNGGVTSSSWQGDRWPSPPDPAKTRSEIIVKTHRQRCEGEVLRNFKKTRQD